MTIGRQDYWYGMLPGKTTFGSCQSLFNKFGGNSILPGANTDLITYTVPTGYKLHVQGIFITAQYPALHILTLGAGAIASWSMYFDDHLFWGFDTAAEFEFDPGDVVVLNVINYDDISCAFKSVLTGFLEQIIG